MSSGPEHPDRPVSRGPQEPAGARPPAPGTSPDGTDAGAQADRPTAQAPVDGQGPADGQTPVDGRGTTQPPPARDAGRTPGREAEQAPAEAGPRSGGKTAGLWISLILGAIVLVLLLIFIIQNNGAAQFEYLGAQFSLPLGVAMLLAAIAGALIMALVGSVRMVQMSWTIRKLRKQQDKIHRTTR